MTEEPVLRLDEVTAGYGRSEVLHDVSMAVGEGEIVSLVGRNGVGKTTTLRTIMGILPPTEGTITYRDADITDLEATDTVRRGIAYVPEDRRIFPDLTVRENLKLARLGGAEGANRYGVEEVLDRFENLRERLDNPGSSLSGGEQQMLTIARALVGGADLLLLDEPTEGLAPLIVEDVLRAVRDLNETGITVLLVEQNVHVALDIADRIYIIDQGQIVYEGASTALADERDVLDRYVGVSL